MTRKTIADVLAEARGRLERLEPTQALAAQQAGGLVIDTRSADERRRTGVIPGSLHIPLSVLEWRCDPATDPVYRNRHVQGLDQHIVLVCAHGYSSSLAAARLQEIGFARATDLDGGLAAWQEAGLPLRAAPEADPGALPGTGDPAPG